MTIENSTEYANANASPPVKNAPTETHGRIRIMYFSHDQAAGGLADSTIRLGRLPAGRVRVLLGLSRAYVNWVTGSAFLDLGWEAYTSSATGLAVAEDVDGLVDNIPVESAVLYDLGTLATLPAAILATGGTKVFESKNGVVITALSITAIAAGDDIAGYLAYVID